MSLRGDDNTEKLDTFMRIGNDLNGLYTKIKKTNPSYKPSNSSHPKISISNKDLEIVGLNKLSLEVEAVKKVGYEYLKTELLETTDNEDEEIIEECYDGKHWEI